MTTTLFLIYLLVGGTLAALGLGGGLLRCPLRQAAAVTLCWPVILCLMTTELWDIVRNDPW